MGSGCYILFGFPPLIVAIVNAFSIGCVCYVWLIMVYTHNIAPRKNSPNCFLPLVFQYSFMFSFLFFTHYLCVLHLFISSPAHFTFTPSHSLCFYPLDSGYVLGYRECLTCVFTWIKPLSFRI